MGYKKNITTSAGKTVVIPGNFGDDLIISMKNGKQVKDFDKDYIIVDALPTSNISSDLIYLVKNGDSYKQFMYVDYEWKSIGGDIDASKIIITKDIPLRGDWDQIGTIKRSDGYLRSSGKSVEQILQSIFYAPCSPEIKASPKLSVSMTKTGLFEIGTEITQDYAVSLTDGLYSCNEIDQKMNCHIDSINICFSDTLGKHSESLPFAFRIPYGYIRSYTAYANISTDTYGKNDIGELTDLKYTPTVNAIQIDGSQYQYTHSISCGSISAYRMGSFYGAVVSRYTANTITSSVVRNSLIKSNCEYKNETRSFSVVPGDSQIIIAVLSGKPTPTLYNDTANSYFDIDKLCTIKITAADLSDENSAGYDIYAYTPAVPFSTLNTVTLTLN